MSTSPVSVRHTLSRPALVITAAYPPRSSGTSVIMYNLLRPFDRNSVVMVTRRRRYPNGGLRVPDGHDLHYYSRDLEFSHRANMLWQRLMMWVSPTRIAMLAKQRECGVVVGVFPDLTSLEIARRTAATAGLPFVPYLHDTVVESFVDPKKRARAERVQQSMFAGARSIMVSNRGMAELYSSNYGLETVIVRHTYWEEPKPPEPSPAHPKSVFWGGGVYHINNFSVARVADAVGGLTGATLTVGTPQPREVLAQHGVAGRHVKVSFFGRRKDYLETLRQQGVLLVGLNWPDESTVVHRDELATIFSTKIPEYLASGRPILAHCPDDYFMARFLRDRGCGRVVSERSPEAVSAALSELLAGGEEVRRLTENAAKALDWFVGDRVTDLFRAELERVMAASR